MKKYFPILILSLLVFSCGDESPTETENVYGCTDPNSCSYDPNVNVYVPNSCNYLNDCGQCTELGKNSTCFNEFVFPLKVGNNWIYNGYDISLNSNNNDTISYCSIIDTVTVDSLYDVINSIYRLNIKSHYNCDGYELEVEVEDSLDTITKPPLSNSNYYIFLKNDEDGLYYYGSQGSGNILFKSNNHDDISSIDVIMKSPFLDILKNKNSEEILDNPRLSIKYPVIENDQWEYFNDQIIINRLVSEVNGDSFTLESIYSFDLNIFHKYSNIGMIHYRSESQVMNFTTLENPDGTGETINLIENYELIHSNIY